MYSKDMTLDDALIKLQNSDNRCENIRSAAMILALRNTEHIQNKSTCTHIDSHFKGHISINSQSNKSVLSDSGAWFEF